MQLKEKWKQLQAAIRSDEFYDGCKRLLEQRPFLEGLPYWVGGFLVGCVAIAYSAGFGGSIDLYYKVMETHKYLPFIFSPVCLVLATWVVQKFAPEAGGTGIPPVLNAVRKEWPNDSVEIHRSMRMKVALVVVISSLLCVLGGGALGREGPMVHISACLFYFVGISLAPFFTFGDHRSWLIAGGAAGVAAAFNAPLAGVVFVLEELAQQHFHRFKTAVITAAIVGGITSQWISGRYLFMGYPRIGVVEFSAIPWAILIGVLCALIALPFHRLLSREFQETMSKYLYLSSRIRTAIFTGLLIAAMTVFLDKRIAGGGIGLIQELLFNDGQVTWAVIGGRFVSTILAHLTGCAGGFLAPSLALGASIGSKLAELVGYVNPTLFVIVGMSAFLSAVIRAPFTAWVIVMEMTDRHSAIFPLMIASMVSYGTVNFFQQRKSKTPPDETPTAPTPTPPALS